MPKPLQRAKTTRLLKTNLQLVTHLKSRLHRHEALKKDRIYWMMDFHILEAHSLPEAAAEKKTAKAIKEDKVTTKEEERMPRKR
jgi:hypothetical protein